MKHTRYDQIESTLLHTCANVIQWLWSWRDCLEGSLLPVIRSPLPKLHQGLSELASM